MIGAEYRWCLGWVRSGKGVFYSTLHGVQVHSGRLSASDYGHSSSDLRCLPELNLQHLRPSGERLSSFDLRSPKQALPPPQLHLGKVDYVDGERTLDLYG